MKINLQHISDSLAMELPEHYCEFARRLAKSKRVREALRDIVSTDANYVIEINERLWFAGSLAGLKQWPDDYFVIGEDGCGNYYIVNADEDDQSVLFYDHDVDIIYRRAESLNDFAARILDEVPLDEEVVHSGYGTRKKKARRNLRRPTVIEFGDDDPAWAQDWNEFVKAFVKIASRGQSESELTEALSQEFGSKPVCWDGTLTELDLREYKSASMEMPSSDRVKGADAFSDISSLILDLRTEEEDYDHVETVSPHILTTLASWRSASVGDTIRFQMMFAPLSICVETILKDRPPMFSINTCGAHLLEVVRRE